MNPTPARPVVELLELIAMGSVSVTARAVADAAPDLSLLQWRVLVVLANASDGLPVSELAARIGSRVPATSRLLGRMKRRVLIESRKDQPDARITTARMTADGRALYAHVVERRRADLAAALDVAALKPSDGAVLARLADALGAYL
jgi:DNA-binding MarR family transcriptional regulator